MQCRDASLPITCRYVDLKQCAGCHAGAIVFVAANLTLPMPKGWGFSGKVIDNTE